MQCGTYAFGVSVGGITTVQQAFDFSSSCTQPGTDSGSGSGNGATGGATTGGTTTSQATGAQAQSPELALTGAETTTLAIVGGALLVVGAFAMSQSRRHPGLSQ